MISEVVMPQMGADMKEGTILRWLKAEGESVNRGEAIAEIETDKANIEIESFSAGVFRKALHQEGDVVPVFTVIAVVADPADDISKYTAGAGAPAAAPAAAAPPQAPAAAAPPAPVATPTLAPTAAAQTMAPPADDARMRVSPVAARIAAESGVDLRTVRGSGPDGRILRRDVEAAAAAPPAPVAAPAAASAPAAPSMPAPRSVPMGENLIADVPTSRMRQTIARRMQESKQQAPHYYLQAEIDMTESVAFQTKANASLGEAGRISVNDLTILATARALVQHPHFNAWWVDDHIQTHSQVNIGIAIPIEGGLVVPAVMDCANKGVQQISVEARDLAMRARSNHLRPEEYAAPTFSISNLGSPAFGVDVLVAIINPPQVGVLGVGTLKERPVVRNGEIVIRQTMNIVLSADHRATDGADGARFLQTVRRYLESPTLMLV